MKPHLFLIDTIVDHKLAIIDLSTVTMLHDKHTIRTVWPVNARDLRWIIVADKECIEFFKNPPNFYLCYKTSVFKKKFKNLTSPSATPLNPQNPPTTAAFVVFVAVAVGVFGDIYPETLKIL